MSSQREPRNATATATLEAGVGTISGACLLGGVDAATAVIRTGGSGGTIIGSIGVAAGISANWIPGDAEVRFSNLHVTITGTTPKFTAYV